MDYNDGSHVHVHSHLSTSEAGVEHGQYTKAMLSIKV
jgi:hypothetical protein